MTQNGFAGWLSAFSPRTSFSLREEYRSSATDLPTQIVSVHIDNRTKQVLDYFGASVGMPQVVTELQNELEETAGAARWVDGADGLVIALSAEGFVFKSAEGQEILKRAAARGQTATVRQLLAAGVPAEPNLLAPGHSDFARSRFGSRSTVSRPYSIFPSGAVSQIRSRPPDRESIMS